MRRVALALTTALALALVGCTASPSPTTSPDPTSGVVLDDAMRADLDDLLQRGFDASGMPGVTAYVSIGDDVWQSSLGVGDLSTEEPFDSTAGVRIASITKTFLATAVLVLVDRGDLSLDAALSDFVPGVTNGDQITVRDLLDMSSGIWDFTSDTELIDRWADDPLMPWTVDDSVALIQGKPAKFAPGEKVVYTDSNFLLLTVILEQVSGISADEAVQQLVLDPLGLDDTRFPAPGETDVPNGQQGYRPPGAELGDLSTLIPISEINPEVASGAGNMTSTVADLVVWAKALATGELLSPELQAERVDARQFDGQKIEFGYGLGIIRLGDVLGHDGAIMGYSTVAMYYPEADATFVLAGNGSSNFTTPTMDIFLTMLQRVYPDQIR